MSIGGLSRAGGALQTLVDELAEELGRSVVVNDPVVRVLYTSKHFGDEDPLRVRAVLQHDAGAEASRFILGQGVARWSGAGMLEGNDEIGMRPRLCVPLREHAELLGLLMVIDADHTLMPSEIRRIEEVSRSVAAVLDQERSATVRHRQEREEAVQALLGTDVRARDRVLKGMLARSAANFRTTACAVVRVHDDEIEPAEAEIALRRVLESLARRHPDRTLTTVSGTEGILVFAVGRDQGELQDLAERLVDGLERLLGRSSVGAAGIGEPVSGLADSRRSVEQARIAARRARTVGAPDQVVTWRSLGPYAPLLALAESGLDHDSVPAPVVALLEHDKGARLVETLRAFLDEGGSIPRTASRLHLHRSSLYYRFDQIRKVTGLDLDDGRNRLLLHVGLVLADLLDEPPPR